MLNIQSTRDSTERKRFHKNLTIHLYLISIIQRAIAGAKQVVPRTVYQLFRNAARFFSSVYVFINFGQTVYSYLYLVASNAW